MTTTQPPAQQPASSSAPPASQPSPTSPTSNTNSSEPQPNPFSSLGQEQIATLLKTLGPSFYQAARPGADPKDSALAAEALSNMAQAGFPHLPPGVPIFQGQYAQPGMEPGPSSHPRGPPNLGGMASSSNVPPSGSDGDSDHGDQSPDGDKPKSSGGRRAGRSATMSNDEWARQRKDNHKEVERRRRGNINEGINELGRIVPNGSGEKAKGAILSRAVQYIHHLKENEARNIEKWTLEKLLMDQAMGDLQAQLEEVRRAWDEERVLRQRLEAELSVVRGLQNGHAPSPPPRGGSADRITPKRAHDDDRGSVDDAEDRTKRSRVD
ncbi:bHLHzip domain-containing protein [Phanerochaete sordida]|uniref:BHLHzip domain-containing protein n=1 Tax=Phanerochaete sordida TaxID=48140 RepID=A0A9P3G7R9_9APHY|nr:bHLHzip domain-containing protein [Phanerochaete sordida]